MRFLTVALLVAAAAPAAAGPLDSLQYRTTLRTDRPTTAGPAAQPGETDYLLGGPPTFGVAAVSFPAWAAADPAYPGAAFSLIRSGGLIAFWAAGRTGDASAGGRYALDVELRDAAGRVGHVSYAGTFSAWWSWAGGWWDNGLTFDEGRAAPDIDPADSRRSVWLGPTRYDVELGFGLGGPYYQQDADGAWQQVWYADDPGVYRQGGYSIEGSGAFYAIVTPAQTPEPATLILASVGVCVSWAARRRRSAPAVRPGEE